jgi:hypothetical protein
MLGSDGERRGARAAPHGRAFTDESLEESRQMRLIGEPTFQSDLTQRGTGGKHQPLRTFNSPLYEKRVRRAAEAIAKRPHEVREAQLGQRGKFRAPNSPAHVLFYVSEDTANVPRSKAAARPQGGALRL